MIISNWAQSWRWVSIQVAAVAVAWGFMPADMQTAVLEAIGVPAARVPAILGLLFIAARLTAQVPAPKAEEEGVVG